MHRKFRKHQQIEKYFVQNLHKKTAEVFLGGDNNVTDQIRNRTAYSKHVSTLLYEKCN